MAITFSVFHPIFGAQSRQASLNCRVVEKRVKQKDFEVFGFDDICEVDVAPVGEESNWKTFAELGGDKELFFPRGVALGKLITDPFLLPQVEWSSSVAGYCLA